MKKTKLNIGILTAVTISLIVVSMISVGLTMFIDDLEEDYNTTTNVSFGAYNYTDEIKSNADEIRKNATKVKQDEGWLDVVGGFFSQGFAALKTSLLSVNILYDSDTGDGLIQQAGEDIPELSETGWFINNFGSMIIIIVFVGVVIAAILKWKI